MRRKPIRRMMLGVLGALALWLAPHANAQCHYEVTVVTGPSCGVLGPASVHFFGINEHGQVCGRRSVCNVSGPSQWLPIVWTEEQGMIVLPLPEGATQGEANDINDVLGSDGFGQIVCSLQGSGLGGERAFLYDDGVWTMLPPDNGSHSGALAINDAGQVAGYRDVNGTRHAFIWQNGVFNQIASPIGGQAYAYDINEPGVVTGSIGIEVSNSHAFRWSGNSFEDLGSPLGGAWAVGDGIGQQGDVVGLASIPPPKEQQFGQGHAARWDFWNNATDLGLFEGTVSGRATAINDAGQVIGSCFSQFQAETPFLWQNRELIRLDDYIDFPPGITGLAAVKAINNRGQIAAYTGGSAKGIILTPIALLGDINLDCQVNGEDLALVLGDWGECVQTGSCLCDIVTNSTFQPPGDGVVDGADLAVVLGNWTDARAASAATRKR